jgi:hypothetical protein
LIERNLKKNPLNPQFLPQIGSIRFASGFQRRNWIRIDKWVGLFETQNQNQFDFLGLLKMVTVVKSWMNILLGFCRKRMSWIEILLVLDFCGGTKKEVEEEKEPFLYFYKFNFWVWTVRDEE